MAITTAAEVLALDENEQEKFDAAEAYISSKVREVLEADPLAKEIKISTSDLSKNIMDENKVGLTTKIRREILASCKAANFKVEDVPGKSTIVLTVKGKGGRRKGSKSTPTPEVAAETENTTAGGSDTTASNAVAEAEKANAAVKA